MRFPNHEPARLTAALYWQAGRAPLFSVRVTVRGQVAFKVHEGQNSI